MTKLKLVFFLCSSLLLNLSCKNKNGKIGITNTEIEESMRKETKTFDTKPVYGINFSNIKSTCQFEILINDIPVFKFLNQRGGINSYIPINTEILQSGKQKLTIKLFPSVSTGKNIIYVDSKEDTPFSLSVNVGEVDNDGLIKDKKNIYELPFIPLPDEGLPYWELEADFEAEVPYIIKGWSDSKVLTDEDDLENKVFEKFEQIKQLLITRDFESFYKISFEKEREINTVLYYTTEQINETLNEYRDAFTEPDAKVQPIEGAQLKFYGNGRLVTLENIEDGKSALRTIIKDESGGEENEIINFPIYLHIPQGSDELEIIR